MHAHLIRFWNRVDVCLGHYNAQGNNECNVISWIITPYHSTTLYWDAMTPANIYWHAGTCAYIYTFLDYVVRKVETSLTMFRCKTRKVDGVTVGDHGVQLCTKPASRKPLQVWKVRIPVDGTRFEGTVKDYQQDFMYTIILGSLTTTA